MKFWFCTDTPGSSGWPSPAPRLHIDDCFEIHNFHRQLCDLLLSNSPKIFCTKYGSANASSARGPCEKKTLRLPKSTLLEDVGSRDSSWEEQACESLCSGTLSATRFSLNSCSHSGMAEHNGSLRSKSWSSFLLGWDFWLAWSTGLSVLSFQHVRLTQILDRNLFHTGAQLSLSLDTVMVGEVDDLEENGGWSISLPWRCHGCWRRQAWGRTRW